MIQHIMLLKPVIPKNQLINNYIVFLLIINYFFYLYQEFRNQYYNYAFNELYKIRFKIRTYMTQNDNYNAIIAYNYNDL